MSQRIPKRPRLHGTDGRFTGNDPAAGIAATLKWLGLPKDKQQEVVKRMQKHPTNRGSQHD